MRKFGIITVVIVWAAVLMRLCLDIYWSVVHGTGPLFGLAKFITAFTSLTNIMIGLILTSAVIQPKSRTLRFLSGPLVMGCAATYITFMAGVFAILIAPIATSVGLQRIVGGFLHGVIPVLYLLYWLLAVPKRHLRVRHVFIWSTGALMYFILILIRGAISGIYPYPFVDVGVLGYSRVMLNAVLLLGVFIAVGLAVVAIDRRSPWGADNGKQCRGQGLSISEDNSA